MAGLSTGGRTVRDKQTHKSAIVARRMQKLSVIIPFYNEQATLRTIVEQVLAVQLAGTAKQIILVDDGSTDGSSAIAKDLAHRHPETIRCVAMSENLGKGAAVCRGLREVEGSLVVIQDADLEYDPADLRAIIEAFHDQDVKVVFGSRRLARKNVRGNVAYHWGGLLITGLTNVLYGSRLTDQATCYKSFRSEVLSDLCLCSTGFEFCAELTSKLLRLGHRIIEVPIRYTPRSRQEGKKIRLRDGVRIAWTLIRLRFSRPARQTARQAAASLRENRC